MQKFTIIISVLFLAACSGLAQKQTNYVSFIPVDVLNLGPAQEQAVPTICILPADVVQGSVRRMVSTDHKLAVAWTYTEAGAARVLAFREAHTGQTVRTVVGNYEFVGQIAPFSSLPGCANYSEWRAGWLKHRTDKFFGISEDDAKKIIAGLKGQ